MFLGVACLPARAAIETNPDALYATMRKAFDDGVAKKWPFASELYYQATVFDAGRSYALFKPTDAQYAEVAALAVEIATQLHYDPLSNNDAAEWYVREAATWVAQHNDGTSKAHATALLAALQTADADPAALAGQAVADARANVASFPKDADAQAALVVAELRAYNLSKSVIYRAAALQSAAVAGFPVVRVPDPEAGELFVLVAQALGAGGDFSEAERADAKRLDALRKATPALQVIGRTRAVPHDLRLTKTAPADEYFGNTHLSPIGVRNELIRINKYLDVGWGDRMTKDAIYVENSVNDWQRRYPHDLTLPQHIYDLYRLLQRVGSPASLAEASTVRSLLLVQYANSAQARQLADS
ncbi:MAG: hypothetical protein GIW95_10085 [Candidatus Eremiobacteraeota bacterium]|nr:hypothetical protein [Candidatus Eremiobacteraeota bacterium]